MRSLDARIRQLEQLAPSEDGIMLIIVRALVGVDNSKLGAERVVHYEPIGLKSMREDRCWPRKPGESLEAMNARVEAELQVEGHTVYVVCEEYADGLSTGAAFIESAP